MKTLIFSALIFSSFASFSLPQPNRVFPIGPELRMTPGKLCDQPDSKRYPEGIPYCERNVDTELKKEIVKEYQGLGFTFANVKREDYKIDHFYPLCMGGSNDRSNLWPQHRQVFEVTDDLERILCEKMAIGKLSQSHAVELIVKAKTHLDQVPGILKEISSLH